jgi:hypothetical protein
MASSVGVGKKYRSRTFDLPKRRRANPSRGQGRPRAFHEQLPQGEKGSMFEIHSALIIAVVAVVIAVRRQPRLPAAYGLDDWNDISARYIYAEKLIVGTGEGKQSKQVELSVDKQNCALIDFPYYIEGESREVSLRCGPGKGGFKMEFMIHPPDDRPRPFMTIGLSPSGFVEGGHKFGPPHVTIFDSKDTVVAQIP